MVALTLTLQTAVSALRLAFGVLALRAAAERGDSPHAEAWYMAGVTFTLVGAVALLHSLAGIVAQLNPGTPFYDVFLDLIPPGNDARSVLVLGFTLALAWVLLLERPWPSRRLIVRGAFALLVAGFLIGFLEPPVEQNRAGDHLTVMSVLGAATAIFLFAALYRGLVRGQIDWLLWTALALYAVEQALSSNIQTVLAWAGFGGAWAPPVSSIMWVGLVAVLAMVACALRRLVIARDGGDVPGLMERLRG